MFNRFFCFLFLVIVGLNFLSFSANIKSKAVDLQKPYISEVWYGDSGYPDKCTSQEFKTKKAKGNCSIDMWIEIANPNNTPISLLGYKLDVSANRSFVSNGDCEDLDLDSVAGKKTNSLYCNPTAISDKANIDLTIAPNSFVIFQEKYENPNSAFRFYNMLDRSGISVPSAKIDLVRKGGSTSYFSAILIDSNNSAIHSFSSNFDNLHSVEVCNDNGSKTQKQSNSTFQAGVKTFYGTPGAKNDCPETEKQNPTSSPVPPVPSKELPKPDSQSVSELNPVKDNKLVTNPVSQVVKEKVDNNIKTNQTTQTNTLQQTQTVPLILPKIEIKVEPKIEAKKIEPVTFKVEQETIPVLPKIEKPLPLIAPATLETKKEIVKEVIQKPIFAEPQKIIKPIFAKEMVTASPRIEILKADLDKSIISQTKVINIVDKKQAKIFGVDITKPATVDMHTIKVNFIYFDLAIILFLLTKTTLENKKYVLKIFELARQKVFHSK